MVSACLFTRKASDTIEILFLDDLNEDSLQCFKTLFIKSRNTEGLGLVKMGGLCQEGNPV